MRPEVAYVRAWDYRSRGSISPVYAMHQLSAISTKKYRIQHFHLYPKPCQAISTVCWQHRRESWNETSYKCRVIEHTSSNDYEIVRKIGRPTGASYHNMQFMLTYSYVKRHWETRRFIWGCPYNRPHKMYPQTCQASGEAQDRARSQNSSVP